ncbi:MAG TPA: hypothetical protein DDZ89_05390, partial [Clostridiales bacterium]|nr:hypothetical protein [Clostridiales bacterium]
VLVSRLKTRNKGLVLSVFVSLRNIFVGAAAYPGAFLYGIHPIAPFVSEGALLVIWLVLFYTYMSILKKKNMRYTL